MRATTVSKVSLAGLTTIGVLLSQVNGVKALSLEQIDSSTGSITLQSFVPEQLTGGSWEYKYNIIVKPTAPGELTSWMLPLLGISDLESIEGETITPDQHEGKGWNLYERGSGSSYQTLWGDPASNLQPKNGQVFSDSPWILAFKTPVSPENSRIFSLISKNGPHQVPFIAQFNVAGSGYAYEVGDPWAPGSSTPQVPTPFLGVGLAAIAAKTATRKRST
jgi:hypothetical protein